MSPESLDPHNARAYRRRARLSRSLGIGAIPVALTALISPATLGPSSVATALAGPLDTAWTLGYLFGGIFAAAGVVWRPFPRPELEALGLWLLIGAMVINGLAIVAIRGPVAGGLTSIGLWVLADALYARTRDLEEARKRERRAAADGARPHGLPDRRRARPET